MPKTPLDVRLAWVQMVGLLLSLAGAVGNDLYGVSHCQSVNFGYNAYSLFKTEYTEWDDWVLLLI